MPNKFIPPQTTTTTRTAATPLDGEILYDTDEKKLYYGDGTTVGGKAIGSPTVTDDVFRVQDNTDSTKQLAFEVSGIATGTTRTLTVPDSNGTVLSTDTLTDKALYYYDASSKLFKPVGVGTVGQTLIAQPSSNPPYQWATPTTREVLTANRTYYIRTDGSDSNSGLTNTSGGAFLTPQKFYDTVTKLDKNGFDVTGKLASGTYTVTTSTLLKSGEGEGRVILEGDTTTPSNVLLTTSSDLTPNGAILYAYGQTSIHLIRGIKFTSTGSTSFRNHAIFTRANSILEFEACDFGALAGTFSQHLRADTDGKIYGVGNYTVSGGAYSHWGSTANGKLFISGVTVTLSGTPAFGDSWAIANRQSIMQVATNTFTGSATGKRYSVSELSMIFVNGAGATYLPGNTSGTADAPTFGLYI